MAGKKIVSVLSALLFLASAFSAAAASYQHGDKVNVTVTECWAFHGRSEEHTSELQSP